MMNAANRKAIFAAGMLFAMAACQVSQAGPKIDMSDESWMQLSILGQPHFSYSHEAEDKGDFYLRRGRLILSGQIADGIRFFAETDNANAGRATSEGVTTELQDIFVDVRLGQSDHWVQAGLILLPFAFEVKSSAASLLGVDYNSEVIKLDNSFVWRDYGVELHGLLGKRLGYHVGFFDGYDSGGGRLNSDAELRYTGHLACSLVGDVQEGWFYTQNRLKDDAYLSVGVGIDQMKNSTLPMAVEDVAPAADPLPEIEAEDSSAWVVDFMSGVTVGYVGITLNGAVYSWDNSRFDGITGFIETGFLVSHLMLTGKYSLQDSKGEGESRVEDYTMGIHCYAKGHNLSGGLEFRTGDSDEMVLCGIQFLL